MDFFALQKNIDQVAKSVPNVLMEIEAFRGELRAHRKELAEVDGRMLHVLNLLEKVSQRQTEIELQMMGMRGATQR